MAIAIFIQGEDNHYGMKKGSIIWVNKTEGSSVDEGELIYAKYSEHGGTFGTVVGDTVESLCKDDIYDLSECAVYRLEAEPI